MSEKPTTVFEGEMKLATEQAPVAGRLQQFTFNRYNAESYRALAYESTGHTEKEVKKIRKHIEALPKIARYRPIPMVLEVLVRHIVEDYAEPPQHAFPSAFETRVPESELAMVLLDEGISRRDLMEVATDIALELHPEAFENGYSDKELHEKRIAEAQQQLNETLTRAASSWTMDDVEFRGGVCTFRLSQGKVNVGNGVGDSRAVEQLLTFLLQPKPVATSIEEPEQEGGEVVDINTGEVRRV